MKDSKINPPAIVVASSTMTRGRRGRLGIRCSSHRDGAARTHMGAGSVVRRVICSPGCARACAHVGRSAKEDPSSDAVSQPARGRGWASHLRHRYLRAANGCQAHKDLRQATALHLPAHDRYREAADGANLAMKSKIQLAGRRSTLDISANAISH